MCRLSPPARTLGLCWGRASEPALGMRIYAYSGIRASVWGQCMGGEGGEGACRRPFAAARRQSEPWAQSLEGDREGRRVMDRQRKGAGQACSISEPCARTGFSHIRVIDQDELFLHPRR